MGEMASALAHELNQPLSAIANYMKGSRRLLESAPTQTSDEVARSAGQGRRAGVARRPDHPAAARFRGRGETERRVESLAKLIEEASALALVGAKERGVRVRFQFDPQRRPRAGRQGPDPAGAAQPDAQRHRSDGRRSARPRTDGLDGAADDEEVAGRGRRHRPGHRAGSRRASCSSRSSPPSGRAWASVCRFRARSSRRMAGESGSRRTRRRAPCSASPCGRRCREEFGDER